MDAPAGTQEQHDALVASMSAQLDELYADRERLVEGTGLMTVDDVLALIESMKAQLESLYAERDESGTQA
jgi:hypothetical protein